MDKQRQSWSVEEKLATVAEVARWRDVSANRVYRWRAPFLEAGRQGGFTPNFASCPAFGAALMQNADKHFDLYSLAPQTHRRKLLQILKRFGASGNMNRTGLFSTLLAFVLAVAAPGPASAEIRLLNVSYDPTREFYQDFNAAFAKRWKAQSDEAVIDGLEADVVTLALAYDIDAL